MVCDSHWRRGKKILDVHELNRALPNEFPLRPKSNSEKQFMKELIGTATPPEPAPIDGIP
jgi:hypothetical protein